MAQPDTAVLDPIEKTELRQAFGHFVTGVTVVTTLDQDGKSWGLTANSFSSVSLDPPLVLWSQSRSAPSFPAFRDAGRFAVNILAENQLDISRRFSSPSVDKFAATPTHAGLGGVALIDGCAAYIECRTEQVFDGGDHAIFLGRVERIRRADVRSLAFARGQYVVARPHLAAELAADLAARDGTAVSAEPATRSKQLRHKAVALAADAADALAQSLGHAVAVAVWGNHGPTVVHWRQPRDGVLDLVPGFVMPVSASATGLAFAAHLEPPATAALLAAEGIEQPESLQNELAAIRGRGLARVADTHFFDGVYGGPIHALSAPVFGADNGMVLALSAIGRADAFDAAWDGPAARALAQSAAELSSLLGYRRPSAA